MVADIMPHATGAIFYFALEHDRPDCLFEKMCPGCGRGVIFYLQRMDEPLTAICPACGSSVDLRQPELIHPRVEEEDLEEGRHPLPQEARY